MTPAVASELVQFQSDQVSISAFLAQPPVVKEGSPALLVLHEWWGLNDHAKDIARRFSQQGYVALAPALYSRLGSKVTTDPAEAAKLMDALSSQLVLRDLNAATRYLRQQSFVDPLRLGVVGFSMGGTLALNQAEHNSDLKAAVVFYGKVPPIETFDYFLCPMLYHYPEQDGWVTRQEVDRLREGWQQFGKRGDVVSYPGCQHAFFNDTRPEVYHKDAAAKAWQKTLEFFARHLG